MAVGVKVGQGVRVAYALAAVLGPLSTNAQAMAAIASVMMTTQTGAGGRRRVPVR
jgi:hypothetical protein